MNSIVLVSIHELYTVLVSLHEHYIAGLYTLSL